jgi:hypothetical protein
MGQEDGLTQTFAYQQLLAAKYQELNKLVDLLQERDDKWMRKLAQDTDWRVAVDRKLQTILNVLRYSIAPSQTIADVNLGSYFRQYLIKNQMRLLLMICRS